MVGDLDQFLVAALFFRYLHFGHGRWPLTFDPAAFDGLTDYVHKLRTEYNMRYIAILDPAISMDDVGEKAWKDPNTGEDYPTYTRGLARDIYIKGEDGEIESGKVWPYQFWFMTFLYQFFVRFSVFFLNKLYPKMSLEYTWTIWYRTGVVGMKMSANFTHVWPFRIFFETKRTNGGSRNLTFWGTPFTHKIQVKSGSLKFFILKLASKIKKKFNLKLM